MTKIHSFTDKKQYNAARRHLGRAGFAISTFSVNNTYYLETSHSRTASRIVENIQQGKKDGYSRRGNIIMMLIPANEPLSEFLFMSLGMLIIWAVASIIILIINSDDIDY